MISGLSSDAPGSDLPVANALWVGGPLTPLAAGCLKSFVAVGQRIVLHAYEQLSVPNGVELADAALTLPRDKIVSHRRTGSYALFSDLFRYQLLRRGADLWVDCDVYCIRPIPRSDYLYGWEGDEHIGAGVLSLPADSELLAALSAFADRPGIPPWARRTGLRLRLLNALGRLDATRLPWGTIGPQALTFFARKLGKERLALASDYLYPVSYHQASRLLDPDLAIADIVTPRTLCLHLYGSVMARRTHVPPSSPAGQIIASV